MNFSTMSFEGAISSMGKTRDEDGTVDRVPDPPQKMWAVLAAFMYKCEVENITAPCGPWPGSRSPSGFLRR